MRKTLTALLILLILALAAYFVLSLDPDRKANQKADGINAIPNNAAAILRLSGGITKWKKFNKTNFAKHLSQLSIVNDFNQDVEQGALRLGVNSPLQKIASDGEIFISAHMTSKQDYDLLFVSKCDLADSTELNKNLEKVLSVTSKKLKTYEGQSIYALKGNKRDLNVCYSNDLILLSTSPILVEDAILQLTKRIALNDQKGFSKLYKTADLELDANLFINYQEMDKLAKVYSSGKGNMLKRVTKFGEWMEVDLKISDESIMLTGLSFVGDSSKAFLSNLKGLTPTKLQVASVLPSSVSYLSYLGYDNFKTLQEQQKKYLQGQQKLYQHQKNIEKINKSRGIDLKTDLFDWIGKEYCFFITEGEQENPFKNAGVAIHSKNIEVTLEKLLEIEKKVADTNHDSLLFMGQAIHNLGMINLLPLTMGEFFKGANKTHYTVLEDYVIFANDVGNLKNVINSYMRGKTLIKDIHFNQFYENFNEESSYFTYINPKRAKNFWSYFLNEDLGKILSENQEILNDFQGIGFQTVSKNKLFSTNIYANYKVIKQDAAVSLIECVLDTTYSRKPWVVINHYTQEKELLLQDDRNTLYLINNVGKIIWKRKMEAPILGDVHMIDRYRNRKYQYLFGDGNYLHLIDRNSNNVDGFPVKLKNKQTKGIAVVDYDKNRKYRILVPSGKQVYNYDEKGKIVPGWSFGGAKGNIATTPQLIQFKKKDYIVFGDNTGKVYTLNRKGEERILYKNSLPSGRGKYDIVQGSSLSNSGILTTDTNGIIMFLTMKDDLEPITTRNFSPQHKHQLVQLNNVPGILYEDEGEAYLYKLSKNKVTRVKSLDCDASFGLQLFNHKGEIIITATDRAENKIYAWDQKGEMMENFPVDGNSEVLVSDLNADKKPEFILGTNSANLLIYSIFE